MSFDIDKCIIPQVWCGDEPNPPASKAKYYSGVGSRSRCMRKGFGAGSATERRKHISADSLQNIPYVGDVMESKFKSVGITDIPTLIARMKLVKSDVKTVFLQGVLVDKNGNLNKKAYNSTILFLYNKGVLDLPDCIKL